MALNGEFESGISTRMLLSTVEQLSYGVPLGTAIDFTLTNHLSADGGSLSDAKRFRQLLQKYI